MNIIQYTLAIKTNVGTEDSPVWETGPGPLCTMLDTPNNRALAESEAFGEIIYKDDGEPEPLPSETDILLELAADHEQRLCMLELGGETL